MDTIMAPRDTNTDLTDSLFSARVYVRSDLC